MVSNDARHLSTDAGRLARDAGERLARHVRSQRLSGPRPSAFAATRPQPEPESQPVQQAAPAPQAATSPAPARAPDRLDTADLARRAGQRLADHIRSQRQSNPAMLTAYAPPFASGQAQPAKPAEPAQAEHAPATMLGHNSAGFDIEDEDDSRAGSARSSGPLDFASLADRAAAIQSAHLAASRKKLTVQSFAVPPHAQAKDSTD